MIKDFLHSKFSKPQTSISVLAAAIAALMTVIATWRFGVGLSGDSACYLSAAENLANGKGLHIFNGAPLTAYAPLLSWILALFTKMSVPKLGALFLNLLSLTLLIFYGCQFVQRHFHSWVVKFLGVYLLAFSIPYAIVSMNLWSEILFIAFCVWSLFKASRYLQDSSWRNLVLFAAAVSLAWMSRYAGLGWFAGATALVFLFPFQLSWKRRLKHTVVFACLAGAANGLWILKNRLSDGHAFGKRELVLTPVYRHLEELGYTLVTWVMPIFRWMPLMVAVALGFYCLLGKEILRNRKARGQWFTFLPHFWFLFSFSLFTVVSVSVADLDPIGHRYASPLYFSALVTFLFYLEKVLATKLSPVKKRILTVLVLLWLGHPLIVVVGKVQKAWQEGSMFYERPHFAESQTAAWLRSSLIKEKIFSNSPEAVYLLAGLSSQDSPKADGRYVDVLDATLAQDRVVMYVHFSAEARPTRLSPQELSQLYALETVAEFSDGGIYRLR